MKEVFIVFIILLILLLILSSLGGSIRIHENFEDDDIPLYEESILPEGSHPWKLNPTFVEDELSKPKPTVISYPKPSNDVKERQNENEMKKRDYEQSVQEENRPVLEGYMNEEVSPFEDDGDFASV